MPSPRINILGAGIAGLSLATQLRARDIPCRVFDAADHVKGHSYGLTLSSQAYDDIAPKLRPALDRRSFEAVIAVDSLVGKLGRPLPPDSPQKPLQDKIRAQDFALRNVLAQTHQIEWSHRLTDAVPTSSGLKLCFENGRTSTAPITIDASGERSLLVSKFLPELKSEILPYAVYHGNRYRPVANGVDESEDLFETCETVKEWQLSSIQDPSAIVYIQLSRSYLPSSRLPPAIRSNASDDAQIWVEIRYTISRPAMNKIRKDPAFNPNRAKHEAKEIPIAFYEEIETMLCSSQGRCLPDPVLEFLDPKNVKQDRLLNWLMRVRCLKKRDLQKFAKLNLLVIGDAAHALPIVGSDGACLAMEDGEVLAQWLEEHVAGNSVTSDISEFYESTGSLERWQIAERRNRAWLNKVHSM